MKRLPFLLFCLVAGMATAYAQIGYQISLLNTATGEPRANETVNVKASISNSEGQVFYTTTQQAKTNDFGVLSLSIGDKDTFSEVDLTKLPFFIEVTANGVLIGKSQILSVPVAEVAKRVAPLDKEKIVGTWRGYERGAGDYDVVFVFNEDGTGNKTTYYNGEILTYNDYSYSFEYFIIGSQVFLKINKSGRDYVDDPLIYYNGSLICRNYFYQKQ